MKEEAVELLKKILKENGYSVTQARLKVFDLFWGREEQSIQEVNRRARGCMDRASIYRVVTLFEKLGLVQRIVVGWKYKLELSDVFIHHHHHISCLGCGRAVAIHQDDEIEALIRRLAATADMTPERHQLEIQGYCKKCRNTRQK